MDWIQQNIIAIINDNYKYEYKYKYNIYILNIDIKKLIMLSKLINKGYEATNCQICYTEFNLLKLQRIHKCKRCNKYVCWRCGSNKQKVLEEEGKWTSQPHRVCSFCFHELSNIYTLVEKKNMKWGTDSQIAHDWLTRMRQNPTKKVVTKDYEYLHFLKLFTENPKNFIQDSDIIDKDVIKGRTDYTVFNYSLRQFFFTAQQSIENKQKIRLNMANVLYAVAARYDQIGYVQGMSSIAAFLLCFCSEETSYTIFCDLIQNIMPDKFLVKGNYGMNLIGLLAQTHFLKEYFIHIVTKVKAGLISHERPQLYTTAEIQTFRTIVQLSTSKALLSMFVNFLSYTPLQFIWKQFSIHRTFEVAERAFLAVMYLNRQQILEHRSFKHLQNLFQNVNYQEFVEAYYDMDIDASIKTKLIEQFYLQLNQKWSNNADQNVKRLHRCTNFTQNEIKYLQSKFASTGNNKQSCDKIINKQDFILLIKCYYDVLKQNSDEQAPILQITSYYVSKIFDSFITNKSVAESPILKQKRDSVPINNQNRISSQIGNSNSSISSQQQANSQYLDFRQFVCCFSLCTKSLLKERMCAIVNTFQDRNRKISYFSFEKLIKNLCEISPEQIEDKKQAFLQRMNRYFTNQEDGITINELYILLNDSFISELTMYIRSDSPDIIKKSVQKLFSIIGKPKEEVQTPQ